MSVLVTNGESNIGLAVMRSLGRQGIPVVSGSSLSDAMSFHSKYCSSHFQYADPRADEHQFIQDLRRHLQETGCEIVFPADWDTVLPISRHRESLEDLAIVPLPPQDTVERAFSKESVIQVAEEAGLPFPKSYPALDAHSFKDIIRELTFPVVLKPYIGASSIGLQYISSSSDLSKAYKDTVDTYGPCVVQEYIPGQKYLFSGLFNRESKPRRMCIITALRQYPPTGGPIAAGITVEQDRVKRTGIALTEALGSQGMVSMDFILDERDNQPKIVDVNPRFFGCMQIAIAAGADYPHQFYRMIKAGDIEEDLRYQVGLRGRSMLIGDLRHLRGTLFGKSSFQKKLNTLVEYCKIWDYQTDLVVSRDDVGPALYESKGIFQRKMDR